MHCTTEKPTRIFTNKNGITTKTAIDYMVTNLSKGMCNCDLIDLNLADHLAQRLIINCKLLNESNSNDDNSIKTKRNLCAENVYEFRYLLQKCNWVDTYNESSVDGAFDTFFNELNWCFNVACPMKNVIIKKRDNADTTRWVNQDIKNSSKQLKTFYWLKTNLNSAVINRQYLMAKQTHKQLIRNTKKAYYSKLIQNAFNKSKELWNIVNSKKGTAHRIKKVELVDENNVKLSNPVLVCTKFGKYFSMVAENNVILQLGTNNNSLYEHSINFYCKNSLFFTPVDKEELKRIINKIPNKNSSGIDGFSIKLIKSVLDEIIEPLVYIINLSFERGEFPSKLKTGLVSPILKKGDSTKMENYRPITVLSTFSKIIERVAYEKICNFLNKYNLINDNQHGFRVNRSTESAIVSFLQYIYDHLDRNEHVASLFFDFSRAFDSVDISIISKKLYDIGIRGVPLDWIVSYLSNRKIVIKLNGNVSPEFSVNLGVPQGSVLGPLIFLLIINDLPNYIKMGHSVLFADDTTIALSAQNPHELQGKLLATINKMTKWSDKNRLILNAGKTVHMNFHKRRPLDTSQFNMDFSASTKLLGLQIDNQLNWDAQIDHICKKLNKSYYLITQLKSCVDINNLLNVYYGLVYPVLSYNVLAWGQARETQRVFVLQKRIIRLIINLHPRNSCKPIFIKHNILTLPCIFIYKAIQYARKNINGLDCNSEKHHNYDTRNSDKLRLPAHNLTLFKKSPLYVCKNLYNKLPITIKNNVDDRKFNKTLKEYLVKYSFYTLNEYLTKQEL